jgi:hypothetical protein
MYFAFLRSAGNDRDTEVESCCCCKSSSGKHREASSPPLSCQNHASVFFPPEAKVLFLCGEGKGWSRDGEWECCWWPPAACRRPPPMGLRESRSFRWWRSRGKGISAAEQRGQRRDLLSPSQRWRWLPRSALPVTCPGQAGLLLPRRRLAFFPR